MTKRMENDDGATNGTIEDIEPMFDYTSLAICPNQLVFARNPSKNLEEIKANISEELTQMHLQGTVSMNQI